MSRTSGNSALAKYNAAAVFVEIFSFIKGHYKSIETGKLSREEYLALPRKMAGNFVGSKDGSMDYLPSGNRHDVYQLYTSYERLKTELGCYDIADAVNNLHRRLRTYGYTGRPIHSIVVDEVQLM